MVVFVAVRAWPTFGTTASAGSAPAGPRNRSPTCRPRREPARVGVPSARLAAGLRDAAETAIAVVLGLLISVLSSIFIVEFAPARLRRLAIPVIRLLASVPSVIYGLIGVLVLVPFVGNHLITASEKPRCRTRSSSPAKACRRAVVILTADDHADHGRADLRGTRLGADLWREGAIALGVNPLRAMLAVTLRAARPAIVAAAGSRPRALSARRDDLRWSPARARSRPTSRTGCRPSSSSRCARWPRRSSTTTKASAHRLCARRCMRLRAVAVLRVRVVGRRLSDQAAPAEIPGAGMSTFAGDLQWTVTAPQSAGRRSSPMTLALGRSFGAAVRLGRGDGAVPDRGGDRHLHGLSRDPVPATHPDLQPTRCEHDAEP